MPPRHWGCYSAPPHPHVTQTGRFPPAPPVASLGGRSSHPCVDPRAPGPAATRSLRSLHPSTGLASTGLRPPSPILRAGPRISLPTAGDRRPSRAALSAARIGAEMAADCAPRRRARRLNSQANAPPAFGLSARMKQQNAPPPTGPGAQSNSWPIQAPRGDPGRPMLQDLADLGGQLTPPRCSCAAWRASAVHARRLRNHLAWFSASSQANALCGAR